MRPPLDVSAASLLFPPVLTALLPQAAASTSPPATIEGQQQIYTHSAAQPPGLLKVTGQRCGNPMQPNAKGARMLRSVWL